MLQIERPLPMTEEEHARSTMGYFEYLKWQLGQITKGSRNKCSSKDAKVLEKFNSLWKKRKEPNEQTSSSSSTRTSPPEEFFSPERERVRHKELDEDDESGRILEEDDEDHLPMCEDCLLKDLIGLSINQIQQERGEEITPVDEVEKRKIKVTKKTQTIFEIP